MQNSTSYHAPGKHRILVIDDNPQIHVDFRKILGDEHDDEVVALNSTEAEMFDERSIVPVAAHTSTASGQFFEVDSAYQGQDGLALVERSLEEGRPYSMAFVDVRMPPGWDGVQTIAQIWQRYPQMQVVICTAYSDYSWEDIVKRLGASDNLVILKKPFDNVEVLQLAHAFTKKWLVTQQANLQLADLEQMVRDRTGELERANERFAKAFRASPLPMAICRISDARFLDANESFLQLFQHPREALLGHSETDLQIWADPADQAKFWAFVSQSRNISEMACQVRTANGVREVLAFSEEIELNQDRCVLMLFYDITDRLKLEEQLRQSQKMEAVGQLAAGVAHDFNNLLTVIRGHAEMRLSAGVADPSVGESLKQISRASERAASLTRQLLAFSRRHILRPSPLDLNELVRNLEGMVKSLMSERIVFQCELADRLPPVHADRWNIEQVLINIIVNARDAMPEGGQLTVRTAGVEVEPHHIELHPDARPGLFVCVSIEDTGCGMNPQTLDRIFEPFFTTKPLGKGTGMGLAVVYGIVKQHRGWISVRSQPGCGTTVHVFLPLSKKPAEAVTEGGIPLLPGGDETIMVVEDDPEVLKTAVDVLVANGYRVLQACSAADALKLWSDCNEQIDLLFTDIVMPGGTSGRKLAEVLRLQAPELKVILTTGHNSQADESPVIPGSLFIAKPYSAAALVKAVRVCLDNFHAAASTDFLRQSTGLTIRPAPSNGTLLTQNEHG